MKYIAVTFFLTGFLFSCSSGPVSISMPSVSKEKPVGGKETVVTGESCGFQFIDFIPAGTNTTLQYALNSVQLRTMGKYVSRMSVQQDWYYGLIGTVLCTKVNAFVIE